MKSKVYFLCQFTVFLLLVRVSMLIAFDVRRTHPNLGRLRSFVCLFCAIFNLDPRASPLLRMPDDEERLWETPISFPESSFPLTSGRKTRVSRFPTAGQGERRLWERDWGNSNLVPRVLRLLGQRFGRRERLWGNGIISPEIRGSGYCAHA